MPEILKNDGIDRLIIKSTQEGLPVTARPYHVIAERIGVDVCTVMQRINTMQEAGIIRRIGVVPNHYKLGYRANGMTVWDIVDERISELGQEVGELDFVSHCYRRPRHLPEWPYNLFAMVHGYNRNTTEQYIDYIREILGDAVRSYDVLYSTRLLKKSGLRI
ncbi:MAG TPA: Lrp/AsnC family transcriptional regulator [Gammaproteobacteria bacterium]|nr:Lrp/AsnC family transcriptional regulator [Gammaproteobacteria bacterium]